jgi:NAD(P)-dependent dehydrogenase (short-subunit alcohol dehydrogenase family)
VKDLSEAKAADILINQISRQGYKVTHLINAARNLDYLEAAEDGRVSREYFLGELELTVVAPYELTMELANHPEHKLENVINVGSQYGVVTPNLNLYKDELPPSINYGVAKAALSHLTKELAVRLARQDIRVNAVALGGLEGRVTDDFRSRYSELSPTGRLLTVSEAIGPFEFLTSELSKSVTGHTLVADGGWTLW